MRITSFFEQLGAPLANSRRSWGGVTQNGVIVLRTWQDEIEQIDHSRYMRVTRHAVFAHDLGNFGYQERMRQLERIRTGSASMMVMCLAVDVLAIPRDILSYDRRDLFVGGKLQLVDGDLWLQMVARVPFAEARRRCTQQA